MPRKVSATVGSTRDGAARVEVAHMTTQTIRKEKANVVAAVAARASLVEGAVARVQDPQPPDDPPGFSLEAVQGRDPPRRPELIQLPLRSRAQIT